MERNWFANCFGENRKSSSTPGVRNTAIQYRALGRSYLDNAELPELLKQFEGNVPLPYDDATSKHVLTME